MNTSKEYDRFEKKLSKLAGEYWHFWTLGDGEGGVVISSVKNAFIKAEHEAIYVKPLV